MSDHTGVTRHLRRLRQQRGLSQSDVARRMFLRPRAVSRLESGRHDPHVSTIAAYCNAIGAHITIRLEEPR
jgi:transcriptional regulator with XRE-family HTH domain